MSRIPELFAKQEGLLVPFLTAGFPRKEDTVKLVMKAQDSGVKMIELGMPFSDPLADGPVIQEASQKALNNGVTLDWILEIVSDIRKQSDIAIVLMGYINPIQSYGLERFVSDCSVCGVDGLILPDLPPEEASQYLQLCHKFEISPILIVAPNSSDERIKKLGDLARHLLYATSILGVTGSKGIAENYDLNNYLQRIRKFAGVPFIVGFGIRSSNDVKQILEYADGAVVGSHLLEILENSNDPVREWGETLKQMRKKE